jgi:hypothetical protein
MEIDMNVDMDKIYTRSAVLGLFLLLLQLNTASICEPLQLSGMRPGKDAGSNPAGRNLLILHFYSCLAGFKPRPSHLQSLFFTAFYNSILQIYISNLGARPVLVRFWDYIFRIWITVCLPPSPQVRNMFR